MRRTNRECSKYKKDRKQRKFATFNQLLKYINPTFLVL